MITHSTIFPDNKIPNLIKVCQVADVLSVSKPTIYKLIDSGELAGADVATKASRRRHLRVTRDSLLSFYQKRFGHSLERALAYRVQD